MVETSAGATSDKRLGYGIIFGIIAVAGAVGMLLAPGELLGAWGFAVAIVAGCLLIFALHVVD